MIWLIIFLAALLKPTSSFSAIPCVNIGLIGNFTREYSGAEDPYGRELQRGFDMGVAAIGKERPCLTSKRVDTNNSVANVRDQVFFAFQSGVQNFIGLGQSQYALAAVTALKEIKGFAVSPTASSVELLKPDTRIALVAAKNSSVAKKTATELRRLAVTRVAIIYRTNLVYSREMEEMFSKAFKDMGGEIVARFGSESSHFDFEAWKTAVKGKAFTHVYLPVYESDAVEIISSIMPTRPDLTYIATNSWNTNAKVMESLAAHPAFKALVPYTYDAGIDLKRNQLFVTSFRSRYGDDPTDLSAFTYEATLLMHRFLARCGESRDLKFVRECFEKLFPFDSLTGSAVLDGEGLAIDRPIFFKSVVGQTSPK